MNTQELYQHITKYMTAEQALLKLLEGQIRTYNNYSANNFSFEEGEAIHPTMLVIMAAKELDWDIAIPNDDNQEIQGMIIGTQDYLNDVLKK